jgi:putative transposase
MVSGVVETVRYTYRLRPGRIAQAALLDEWGRCRWLWNEAVHQQQTRRKPTFNKLSKMLTEARSRNAWLRAGSQVAQQQTLRTYGVALDQSFKVKGRGRPKLKRKKDALPSLEYTTRGFSIKNDRLCLPGKVSVPAVWSRDLPGIGVDWGVRTTATTTDPGFDLPHLGHRRRCAAAQGKLQRMSPPTTR